MTTKPLTADELRAIRSADELCRLNGFESLVIDHRRALLHHIDHLHGLLRRAKQELEHDAPRECWAKGQPDDASTAALIEATVVCPGCQIVNAINALLSGHGLPKDGGG